MYVDPSKSHHGKCSTTLLYRAVQSAAPELAAVLVQSDPSKVEMTCLLLKGKPKLSPLFVHVKRFDIVVGTSIVRRMARCSLKSHGHGRV